MKIFSTPLALVVTLPLLHSASPVKSQLIPEQVLIEKSVDSHQSTFDKSGFNLPVQRSFDQENILKHLGGQGPYISSSGFGIPNSPPFSHKTGQHLKTEKVFILARHGERYPTKSLGEMMNSTYTKLKSAKVVENDEITGPLDFVKHWNYLAGDKNQLYENLTFTGPFNGYLETYKLGEWVRKRYSDLVKLDENGFPIFTSDSKRVFESAIAFSNGFFNSHNVYPPFVKHHQKGISSFTIPDDLDYESWIPNNASIVVIPEDKHSGANTLTAGKSCKPYNKQSNYPPDAQFSPYFFHHEAKRLNDLSPGFDITSEDIYSLCSFCGFELNTWGYSDVCNALSDDTLVGFEYLRDVGLWYTKADHPFSFTLGSLYVNATLGLFEQEQAKDDQDLYVSFSHDTDLLYYLNAIGILDYQIEDGTLSIDQIDFHRFFKTSELIPMGARIVVELLSDTYPSKHSTDQLDQDSYIEELKVKKYVRIIINDEVYPLKHCQDGPGYTCKLTKLRKRFNKKVKNSMTDYIKRCEIKESRPQYLNFYWDWKDKVYVGNETSSLI